MRAGLASLLWVVSQVGCQRVFVLCRAHTAELQNYSHARVLHNQAGNKAFDAVKYSMQSFKRLVPETLVDLKSQSRSERA
jgi:hypothetical protein